MYILVPSYLSIAPTESPTEVGYHSPEPQTFWEELKEEYNNCKEGLKDLVTKAKKKKKYVLYCTLTQIWTTRLKPRHILES